MVDLGRANRPRGWRAHPGSVSSFTTLCLVPPRLQLELLQIHDDGGWLYAHGNIMV